MNEPLDPKRCAEFLSGSSRDSYKFFGSHICDMNICGEKVRGVFFSIWAPAAKRVRAVGDFNEWEKNGAHIYDMERNAYGIWSCFIKEARGGQKYKYIITRSDGSVIYKSDPYARSSEMRPATASIITAVSEYEWSDTEWMEKRNHIDIKKSPLNIYEIHLGSWKRGNIEGMDYDKDWREIDKRKSEEPFLNYREIADSLCEYVKKMNYTHVEIMPVSEHPLDGSWGYQITGYYSITSRYGSPDDFRYFVNTLHKNGIGVILDWVPGHFCKDDAGLYNMDGEMPYEPRDAAKRENSWGTANFDLGKGAVRSFLISNAIYFIREFHIDGIRADAVANILYYGYGRENVPNESGADFLRALNRAVADEKSGVIMIAEDSSVYPGVTKDIAWGGLGFDFKWNMGWMNDTLKYMEADYTNRRALHNNMTFSMLYAYSENYILPLSHDEVVHGKKSLIDKMSGDYDSKFASLRTYLIYMMTHPGKKLSFMGNEIGQFMEWRYYEEIEWKLLLYPKHEALRRYVGALGQFYKENRALWELDCSPEGFKWIDADNSSRSIFSYIRYAEDKDNFLLTVCNFTPRKHAGFKIGVPRFADYMLVFSSGDIIPANKKQTLAYPSSEPWNGMPYHIETDIDGYSALIFKPVFRRKKYI